MQQNFIFDPKPGLYLDDTPYSVELGWSTGDNIFFRYGKVEPLRPWEIFHQGTILGIPRGVTAWNVQPNFKLVGIGTDKRLYIHRGGEIYNITPIRSQGVLIDPFYVEENSAVVIVNHNNHGCGVGDIVTLVSNAPVGGVLLNGDYEVITASTNSYRVIGPNLANAAGPGGGTVNYIYEINTGLSTTVFGVGYGAGLYGAGLYGGPRNSITLTSLRVWTLDSWGEDLLAVHNNGNLYHWDATLGVSSRATLVVNAPTNNTTMVVDNQSGFVILLGANGNTLQVAWCDRGDFNNWTIGPDSLAGSRLLYSGSKITGGYQAAVGSVLIWTDDQVFRMVYDENNPEFIFNIVPVGASCSVIALRSMISVDSVVYWMGFDQFYVFDGTVQPIPCSMERTIFDNFDHNQAEKTSTALLRAINCIVFTYPIKSGGYNTVLYNYAEKSWSQASALQRSAWLTSLIYDHAFSLDENGIIYTHTDQPVEPYVDLTLKTKKWPYTVEQITKGPYRITESDPILYKRIRGRQLSIRYAGDAIAPETSYSWYVESGQMDIENGDYVWMLTREIPDIKWVDGNEVLRLGRMRFTAQPDGLR